MRKYLFLFLVLLGLTKDAFALTPWFNDLIAAREKGTLSQVTEPTQSNAFFTTHALVLFYASTCPHCHALAPVVSDWVTRHQATLMPLSFDNQPLPPLINFVPATPEWVNAAFTGRPITYPALFVVNRQTKALYPVAMGSMTSQELEARMKVLLANIKAYERRGDSR